MLGRFRNIVVADFEFDFGGHESVEAAARSEERRVRVPRLVIENPQSITVAMIVS
jgi:hypothetical protein